MVLLNCNYEQTNRKASCSLLLFYMLHAVPIQLFHKHGIF